MAFVYMDNTTWVARSQENLKNILNFATDFYRANDSSINAAKLQLLIFNASDKDR